MQRDGSSRGPIDLRIDVTAAASVGVEQTLAAWLFLPPPSSVNDSTRLIICLPGGTYDKRYYHLDIPGREGYSMAEHLAEAGHIVVSIDHWGVGESSRPPDASSLMPSPVAAVNHAACVELVRRTRNGTLDGGIHALPGVMSVGIGHSMGGMLTIVQQAAHRTHAQIAILGKSALRMHRTAEMGNLEVPTLDPSMGYVLADRSALRRVFYLDDVPDDVVAADSAALVEVPVLLAAHTNSADVASAAAALIDVPVFLGVGERDTVADVHDEARLYPRSEDMTLFVLPGSGHCHNFATTRAVLWDRLVRWIASMR
jgi:pimeloyl-ACP methyl ester carboxylesterase